MATLLSCATGNWTSASTWALIDATSFTGTSSEGNTVTSTTLYQLSSTFTPGAITIDAIAIHLYARLGITGTMSVALDQATTTVTGTEVTINMVDLPLAMGAGVLDGGWIVFKFATPITLTAATAYSVKFKTSTISMVSVQTVSAANISRMLRTTTTQAPVAGDDLHIAGEYTGAGTSNSLTVTMDQTAATDYGSAPTAVNSLITPGVGISSKGTLKWNDASVANPLLRLSNSLIVYNGGTLNMGTVATPIPRDSRAILEFDQLSADGDYGLVVRNGGIFNGQGLSRTSGKNIVSCKLAADALTTANLLLGITASTSNSTNTAFNAVGPDGVSRMASTIVDNGTNAGHAVFWTDGNFTNTTQVASVWLARGTGTNNRYCRVQLGSGTQVTLTNGFYVDVDLQAGSVGTVTAVGNGAAISASITAVGSGYVVTIIGKVNAVGSSASILGVCCANASGVVSYAGDTTNNLIYYGPQLFTASALPSADLTVDTDTGWLTGDMIAVASTTRTVADCEPLVLASNAGASTLTSSQVITNNHSGTTPTQAEIILLTRNVVVRSTSSTLMTYVNVQAGGVTDLDWVQFYYLGEATTNKRGIEIGASSSLGANFDMQYCSVHDCEDNGVYVFPASSGLITKMVFSYNTMWNLSTSVGPAVQTATAVTPTNWTMDHNILIRTGSGNGFTLSDVGGTFTNNTVVGAASIGVALSETSGVIGTFSGNVAHASGTNGFAINVTGITGTISSCVGWRCNSSGLTISSGNYDILFSYMISFGNSSANVAISAAGSSTRFTSPIINSDTPFSSTTGISVTGALASMIIEDGDFSTVSGIKTAHSAQDIQVGAGCEPQIIMRNTKCGAATEVSGSGFISERGYVSSQKHDATAGNHVTWMKHGRVQTDTSVYRTAAPSMRMSPSMAVHPVINAVGNVSATQNSADITVPTYFFDWVVVGDWMVLSGAFANGGRVTAINAGTNTITMDRFSTANGNPTTYLYRGKLSSAPPGKGFQIAANSGQTFSVGVWVRKQAENLFTYSEDFSNAAYSVTNSTRTGSQVDWSGGSTASQFLETTGFSALHGVGRASSTTCVSGATYIFSFYVKAIGRQWIRIREGTGNRDSWIDLTNGIAGTTNAAHTVGITSLGSGWYRVAITFVTDTTGWSPYVLTATADNNLSAFTGDVTKGFFSGAWQIEQSSTVSAYQVTTASAISGYNGNQPRLIQRANPAIGIANDVVLDTMSVGNGTWENLMGTTTAPTGDAGVVELVVDCDGVAGWINIDDFSVT